MDIRNPLSASNLTNSLKAINERIADIGRELGTDSGLYERYERAIESLPPQFRGTSKSGFVKIKTGKAASALLNDPYYSKILNHIQSLRTRGEFKEKKRQQFKSQYGRKPTNKELQAEIDAEKEARQAMQDGSIKQRYEELTSADISTLEKSFNTWEEIRDIFKKINESKARPVARV